MGPQIPVEPVEAVTCVCGGWFTDEPTRVDPGCGEVCRLTGPDRTPPAVAGGGGGLTPGWVPGVAAVLGP